MQSRRTIMDTKMEDKSCFPGDNHYVASDGEGHHGEGGSPEQAQERLEQAQASGNEWEKPLGSGPRVD